MRIKIVRVLQSYSTFETSLNEKIRDIEQYYKIIDIKYSVSYDNINHQQIYSALILYEE